METILFLLAALIVLDLAAWKWGVDSGDGLDNREWQQRQAWTGFH